MTTFPGNEEEAHPDLPAGVPPVRMTPALQLHREKRLRHVARRIAQHRPDDEVSVWLAESVAKLRVVRHGRTLLRLRLTPDLLDTTTEDELASALAAVRLEPTVDPPQPLWLSWTRAGLTPG